MKYQVKYTEQAAREIKKLNPYIKSLIRGWIEKNLQGTTTPRIHGKALVGNKSGLWRYRIGDYRIIADIQDEQITIIILEVGHRKNIYN